MLLEYYQLTLRHLRYAAPPKKKKTLSEIAIFKNHGGIRDFENLITLAATLSPGSPLDALLKIEASSVTLVSVTENEM